MTEYRTVYLKQGKGFDVSTGGHPLAFYNDMKAQGYAFVLFDTWIPSLKEDVSLAHQAGLSVAFFQGYDTQAWKDPHAATMRAMQGADTLIAIGAYKDVSFFLDCEDMIGISRIEALNWLNAWDNAVRTKGFTQVGKYVGPNCPLTGQDWYNLTGTTHYWKSLSDVPAIPNRGYQIMQTIGDTDLFGVTVDLDTASTDLKGGMLTVWEEISIPKDSTTPVVPSVDSSVPQTVADPVTNPPSPNEVVNGLEEPSVNAEGGDSSLITDLTTPNSGITPNTDAPTVAVEDIDAALYQRLKIIPTTLQTGKAKTEVQCLYAGLSALEKAGATVPQIAWYLEQCYGYNLYIAQSFAQSVYDTGAVFGNPLPKYDSTWDFAQGTPDVTVG